MSDRVVLVRIVLKWLHERTGLDFGLQGFFVPLGLKQSDQIESLAREHHKDKMWDNSWLGSEVTPNHNLYSKLKARLWPIKDISAESSCILVIFLILGDPGAVSRAGTKIPTKVFKHGRKSPWLPTLAGPFRNGQANAGSWLGTKNALYYCAQSADSISWVLFLRSYTTAIVSPKWP